MEESGVILIGKVIQPRRCPKCHKKFYCSGNCPNGSRRDTASKRHNNCYCKECYIKEYGEFEHTRNLSIRTRRRLCYENIKFNPSRR